MTVPTVGQAVSDPASPPVINGKILLTVPEACEYLQMGRSRIYLEILSGRLRSVKIGRSRRVPTYALAEFVQRLTEAQVP